MAKFKHHPIQVQYQNIYKCVHVPEIEEKSLVHENATKSQKTIQYSHLSSTPRYTPDSSSDSDSEYSVVSVSDLNIEDAELQDSSDSGHTSEPDCSSNPTVSENASQESTPSPSLSPNPPRASLILKQPLCTYPDYMRPGEIVALVQNDVWDKVVLNSHTGRKRATNGSFYWNYSSLDGSNPTGGYLHPGQSWGVLRGKDVGVDLSTVNIMMPQDNAQD